MSMELKNPIIKHQDVVVSITTRKLIIQVQYREITN